MMKKPGLIKIVFPFVLVIVLIPQFLVQTGCANIIPPEGGPRDTLPPVLMRATPRDSALNFNAERITLVFDEYVDADNYLQEMIVSPVPANLPNVTRKLNTVTVKLRDSLQPNTTYSINFGNTIKDVNEGNPMKNFTYIFSTGNYFDSLEFSGNVILAETGEVDTTLTILLHSSGVDSALVKEKPRYVTRTDGTGTFRFRNLPPDTFYVYAMKDEGGSYRYMDPTQLFAFHDTSVIVGDSTRPVTLYAYAGKETPRTTTATTTEGGGRRQQADRRLKFVTNLSGNKQDLLEKFIMTFETKLKTFDSTRVRFSTDSTYRPLTGYRWELDSTRKILSLTYPWQEGAMYHLVLEKDFATDSLNQQLLKADTIDFQAKEKREYGKLVIRFRNLDLSQNPVLQFVQNNEVKNAYPLTSATFTQELVPPGDYNLRLLNDRNKNGIWDPGVFFGKRQQPERVKPIQRTVNIKPNWDNAFDIDVNAAPAARPGSNQPTQNPRVPGRPNNSRPNNRF